MLEVAAALMLQGLTAHYLASSAFSAEAGHTALVTAAAGGVGLLLCQVLHRRGVRVIGTVGHQSKVALADQAGAADVVRYREEDLVEQVRRLARYIADRAELQARADDLFHAVAAGDLQVRMGGRYPLADADQAHRDLESGETTGKLILVP